MIRLIIERVHTDFEGKAMSKDYQTIYIEIPELEELLVTKANRFIHPSLVGCEVVTGEQNE